jgi:quercetin dioxygenase-like cupin family protein
VLVLRYGRRIREEWLVEEKPAVSTGLTGVVSQSELVQYQTGAVISRTLLKKPGGTVTVFAFDAGEGLSEHTAPFDALVSILEGEAEISIAGTPHRLKAGDLLRLPAREPHAVKAATRLKMLLIMIRT